MIQNERPTSYEKQSLNALAASYRADLLYYIERAKLGKCPPHWQAYCFGEIAAAKGTDAYPEDGDALLDELHRLVDTVPRSRTARKARRRSPPTAADALLL